MRSLAAFLIILSLAACKRGPNQSAIRQGVMDRLSSAGLNVDAMNVNVQSFEPKGDEVDVTVAITLKADPQAPPTMMRYRMREQGGKWVVVARHDGAASPHGAGPASPHGGAAPESGKMPSLEDLPPAGKKK